MKLPATMENNEITNHVELHRRIMTLNYLKEEQEMEIKRNLREVAYSIHPSMIFKNVMNRLLDNHDGKGDLKSVGVSIGKDYLISKLFGRGNSIKGFLTSLVVKKATDYVINNNPELISKGFDKVMDYLEKRKSSRENKESKEKELVNS